MNWIQHLIVGALAGLILCFFISVPIQFAIILIIFSAFSALAPDIDHSSSKIRQIADFTVPVFSLFFAFFSTCSDFSCVVANWMEIIKTALIFTGIYAIIMIYLKPKHRGITHTLFFSLIYGAIVFFLAGWHFALAGLVGYLSHLLADRHIRII